MPNSSTQTLGSKETAQYKSLLKFYEFKQYKKGLKVAEQILKKYPNHGETLAMKGLFLSSLERQDEGFECVRAGLKQNLTSHICWHVFGLLHRATKNFEEAIKCYTHALKYDKNNMQILRDLALLQTQMRSFDFLKLGYSTEITTTLPQSQVFVDWPVFLTLFLE